MTACHKCGTEPAEIIVPDWYDVMVSIWREHPDTTGKVFAYDHCAAWMEARGVDDDTMEMVVLALDDQWDRKGWTHQKLWRVAQVWSKREKGWGRGNNGTRPALPTADGSKYY